MLAMCEATAMTDMNADKFINDLGGTAVVAAMTDDRQNTVSGWRKRGIPAYKLLQLIKIAKAENKPIPAAYRKLLP